ncbi:MAG: glycoside hydrolase family 95 protein [Lacipirellulaceae bacterium]
MLVRPSGLVFCRVSLLVVGMTAAVAAASEPFPQRSLVFDRPADHFTQSCVLGNGRLGAMVFGRVVDERVVLNESGMWSGSPQQADRADAHQALPAIRRLLVEGKEHEAQALLNQRFVCDGPGTGAGAGKSVRFGCYQTLGELRLETLLREGGPSDYRRELNLATGIATTAYTLDGVRHRREAFVSKPDEVIAIRVSADRPGGVSFDAWLERPERATVSSPSPHTAQMSGQLEDGGDGKGGVRFGALLSVRTTGGSVASHDGRVAVRDADEALLFVAAATDIKSFAGRRVDDALRAASDDLARVESDDFDALRERHTADHAALYDRVSLRLGNHPPATESLPERLAERDPDDADLVATLFDYGRYLLVGSSRPGGFPANLQGVWAEELQTPWNGDWHTDINVQMNYWPAGVGALSELQEPLASLVESAVEPGGRTARAYYGARGWVSHVVMNPWGFTSPGESAAWGSTPTCAAWLCQQLWEQYLFTGDRAYLQRVYPLLRGSARFYADVLVEEPAGGWLVTAPSNSPENAFRDAAGRETHTCMGPTIDQQLVRHLFRATIAAAKVLGKDAPFVGELESILPRLAPTRVGSDGRVLEWLTERPEVEPQHRHVSHLWGLYPGVEIDRRATPELAQGARRSLETRGDGGTGWAIAHKACLWARLGDGDHALLLLRRLLEPVDAKGAEVNYSVGGVYSNLLVAHPPFQIDGNFGAAAAIGELLLQSRYDTPDGVAPVDVELLPALPSAWPNGAVRGLRTRGNVEVDLVWDEGRLVRATLTPHWAHVARVRYGDTVKEVHMAPGVATELTWASFSTP